MKTPGDNELIEATLAGDRGAFGELVERYQIKIYNMALRVTGNREDALDVSQAAFLKAYNSLGRFKPAHRFFSWIYRIGMNEALDVVGRRRRYSELDSQIPATGLTPEGHYRGQEAGKQVQAALMKLKPTHRAIVVLRHFHGLSYREISEIVGVTEQTVKSRLFTARRELRQLLATSGATP